MFDRFVGDNSTPSNSLPREAFVVFVWAIGGALPTITKTLTGSQSSPNQKKVREAMILRTVCHEFGHLFNLGHDEINNVMSKDKFLLRALKKKAISERLILYKKASQKLCKGHRHLLELAYTGPIGNQWISKIHPGKKPFVGGLSCKGKPLHSSGLNVIGWEEEQERLFMELSPNRPYFIGEPLCVEINFNPYHQLKNFSSTMLEPGYDCIEFWLTNPIGEKRLFIPNKFVCQRLDDFNDEKQPTSPFHHNPRLHWGIKGPTFSDLGVYQVEATIFWEGIIFHSNVIEIEIILPVNSYEQEFAQWFCNPSMALYLLFHGPRHLGQRVVRRVNTLLKNQATLSVKKRSNGASYMAYIRAKSLIERVVDEPTILTMEQIDKAEFQTMKGRKDRLRNCIQEANDLLETFILQPKKKCKLIDGKPAELSVSSRITAANLGCLTASLLKNKRQLRLGKTLLEESLCDLKSMQCYPVKESS